MVATPLPCSSSRSRAELVSGCFLGVSPPRAGRDRPPDGERMAVKAVSVLFHMWNCIEAPRKMGIFGWLLICGKGKGNGMVMAVDGSWRCGILREGPMPVPSFCPFPQSFLDALQLARREGETNCLEKIIIQSSTLAGLGLSSRAIVLVGWG